MLGAQQRAELAQVLQVAEAERVAVPPLAASYPDLDTDDAYRIQLTNVDRRVRGGVRVVGHKVGLSSKAMQQMMGVDEPDYGHLLSDMALDESVPVDPTCYLIPRVEPEVAFVLGADLPGEGCTGQDVLEATSYVAGALELIDSRIENWKIGPVDTVADNASSAGFVLGARQIDPLDVDLTAIPVTLTRNADEMGVGRSDAVLGNPVTSVAWLARKVAAFGVRLQAGHVILPGSCTRAVDARPGDVFRADFGPLGPVSLTFGGVA